MRIDLGHDEEPEIGLIALIDCIFFLLMFFMVATSFKQVDQARKEKELAIQLPQATATLVAAQAAKAAPLVITLNAQGSVFIDNTPLSLQALHDRLREEAARNPARPIRLDGDRRTPYQHIVRVLDLAQFEGLTQVSLRTTQ
ncbi:ExbD/TolR family protein [Piscinibacterium candidicorallinum]|uniref:ExbD/TolR family protein n=1 Tax=Piscinibacterium candidicorallinum TaxID=1793872 RepID=A0ABV7H226_9BURK